MTHEGRTCDPIQANPFFDLRRGGGTGTACSPFGGNGGRMLLFFGNSTSCSDEHDRELFEFEHKHLNTEYDKINETNHS